LSRCDNLARVLGGLRGEAAPLDAALASRSATHRDRLHREAGMAAEERDGAPEIDADGGAIPG
jgi:hypothetical protein